MLLAAFVLQTPPAPPPTQYCVPNPACVGTNTGYWYGDHTLCVTATNHVERYRIEGPTTAPDGTHKPLIVFFHQYGGDYTSAPLNSPVWVAAKSAGYLVVSHDCGWDANCDAMGHKTYGSEEFHAATQAVMDDLLTNFASDIDTNLVYAYGFSMGGGNALNYAARHQDPAALHDLMFAAVADHSGFVCNPLEYFATGPYACSNSISTCTGSPHQSFWDNLYGASYCNNDFLFQRATVLDWSVSYQWNNSLAWNLLRVPVGIWYDLGCETQWKSTEELATGLNVNTVQVTGHTWGSLTAQNVQDVITFVRKRESTYHGRRSTLRPCSHRC